VHITECAHSQPLPRFVHVFGRGLQELFEHICQVFGALALHAVRAADQVLADLQQVLELV